MSGAGEDGAIAAAIFAAMDALASAMGGLRADGRLPDRMTVLTLWYEDGGRVKVSETGNVLSAAERLLMVAELARTHDSAGAAAPPQDPPSGATQPERPH